MIKIELTPYAALSILSFLREYINEDTQHRMEFQAINECVLEYEKEVFKKTDLDHLEDALVENNINKMLGKAPSNAPNDIVKKKK